MAIEKMTLVQITGKRKNLDRVLASCAKTDDFHPEQISQLADHVGGFTPISEENPYKTRLSKIVEIADVTGIDLSNQNAAEVAQKNKETARAKEEAKQRQELKEYIKNNESALSSLEQLGDLQLSIDDLLDCEYLKFRFGKLPVEGFEKLKDEPDQFFLFLALGQDEDEQWGIYFTTDENLAQVDALFQSLGFQLVLNSSQGQKVGSKKVSQAVEEATGYLPMEGDNPYKGLLTKIFEIATTTGIDLKEPKVTDVSMAPDSMDAFLEKFDEDLKTLVEYKQELRDFIQHNESALSLLEKFDSLKVSVDDIFACQYVKVRFGKLPIDSYDKLRYYSDRLFLFLSLSKDKKFHWGVYFTTEESAAEVDDIFSSLYFERIWIPKTIHGTPEMARQNLEASLKQTYEDVETVDKQITDLVTRNREAFLSVYAKIYGLNETFEMRKYVGVHQDMFHITGFIPTKTQKKFAALFDGIDEVHIDFKPHDSDKRLETPTKLKNNWFVKPFEMFVDMYGVPSYKEVDPTPFVAITYTLLFGIMFGDLGQGLAISLIGYLLYRFKRMSLGPIMVRIGISSAIFGFLYGSVFGLEHVLDPFYVNVLHLPGKPVEIMDPGTINTLLIVAIGLGVALIIASMLMNIYLGFKNKDWEKAIFSNNGIAGLVFYGSILVGVVAMFTSGKNLFTLPYILGFIVLPILVIFLKDPLGKLSHKNRNIRPEEGIGSFIIDGFFELFEVVLSFITNTMSFLRVGGFIISHAGMMAVVLSLSEMMSASGSVIVLIFGNLFVMALEGFIVGIQVLRLEFYEMFSHYFEGQGKPFRPITAETVTEE